MPYCAFCSRSATLTGEHIWSQWMGKLFPEQRLVFRKQLANDPVVRIWETSSVDLTVKIVCEPCNNGWMSDLEAQHAKPAMQDMILSDRPVLLSAERIYSISVFAFKTAVIGYHMERKISPSFPASVFSRSHLRRFATSLRIPAGVQVWIGCIGTDDPRHGLFRMRYAKTPPGFVNGFKLYACTFGIGRFVLQLVATEWTKGSLRRRMVPNVGQNPIWNSMAIPVWPTLGQAVQWPPSQQMRDDTVNGFSDRWRRFTVPAVPLR